MSPILLYIARSSLYLALFYAFFLLVMRRTSFFRLNRILLLAGTLLCFLLPGLRVRTVEVPLLAADPLTETASELPLTPVPSATPFPYLEILYGIGFLAVLGWTLMAAVRMHRTIRKGTATRLEDGTRLVLTEDGISSFSWGRRVVMSRSDYARYPAILAHERQHIRCRHSLDVLLMTGVCALHWFNPLAWIAHAELKLLHEYEADEGLLRQGIDATQYQLLLVRKAVGEQRFSLANGFNHAKLKQRINMMQRNPSSPWMRLSYLALLPLLAGTMFLCNPVRAQVAQSSSSQTVPFSLIEKKPTFQGGDVNAFSKWVSQNMTFPEDAKKAGAQGRVMVAFDVCEDGVVRNVKVLRGVNAALDAEALRVINSSPKWEPGLQDGKPVKVSFQFPVIFRMK